jgi:biopolymer transport protein ExbB
MWEFLRAGGPFMFFLVLTSIVAVAFIIERGFALRWKKVVPPAVEEAMQECHDPEDLGRFRHICQAQPSALSRLLLIAMEHLGSVKTEAEAAVQTQARHEVLLLERGLVILEIIVGIAPLLGLVGTIHGLITLFGDLARAGMNDNTIVAKGIAIALNTTLTGLLIAIPSLIAWSYYNKKVETLAVEMERMLDEFLRRIYKKKRVKA